MTPVTLSRGAGPDLRNIAATGERSSWHASDRRRLLLQVPLVANDDTGVISIAPRGCVRGEGNDMISAFGFKRGTRARLQRATALWVVAATLTAAPALAQQQGGLDTRASTTSQPTSAATQPAAAIPGTAASPP